MEFVDLHHHSTYSFLDAYGTPEQIVKRAKQLNRRAIALTDHGNISGIYDLEKNALAEGIKPIFGCEFYCVRNLEDTDRFHLTVLARNLEGYRNLLFLVAEAWNNVYKTFPLLPLRQVIDHKQGLIILGGCLEGLVSKAILADNGQHLRIAKLMQSAFAPYFYLEIQPFDLAESMKVNTVSQSISAELSIPLVATCDVHYPEIQYRKVRNILRAIRARKKWNELDQDTQDMSARSPEEIAQTYRETFGSSINWQQAMDNTLQIADLCESFTLPKAQILKFGKNSAEQLRQMCLDGMKYRRLSGLIYEDRLQRELILIQAKRFDDYFLVVADMVMWAKQNNIFVGPSRGSSAGSLVCYLLRITEIDPIQYGLLFERFLDETRTDYPDIDVDFDSDRRIDIIQYMQQRYGSYNVASVSTFAEFKGKNSIDEIQKIYQLPGQAAGIIKQFLIERSIADARASFTIEDTMDKFPQVKRIIEQYPSFMDAKLLEGQLRHFSTHAAGIIVSNRDLREITALYDRDGSKMVSCDKNTAEYMGLLKIDILALSTLSIIRKICDTIGWAYQDLINIPLDDPKTMQGFKDVDVKGVFQFDGEATKSVLASINPDTIKVLVDITALSKPGPLHSRSTKAYIDIRNGKRKMGKEVHPLLSEVTKDTYGQILYQEQVMSIVRNIGGFSWQDTNKIRKAMAKSLGQEFMGGFQEQFVRGALERGVNAEQAKEIWAHINTHGSWSFNQSHAAGYAVLGYWMMYLKQHFPLEFYWAYITVEKQETKRNEMLIYMLNKGYKLLPPRINKSEVDWTIESEDKGLRAGLTYIKGLGEKTAKAIVAGKPYVDFADMQNKISKRVANAKIDRLAEEHHLFEEDEALDELSVIKMFHFLDHPQATHKIGDLRWMDEKRSNMILCCFIKSQMLYNIFEEDKIRGIARGYDEPEKADYLIVTLADATGEIRGEVGRKIYHRYADLLRTIDVGEPVLLLCDQSLGRRFLKVKRIKKLLGEENGTN